MCIFKIIIELAATLANAPRATEEFPPGSRVRKILPPSTFSAATPCGLIARRPHASSSLLSSKAGLRPLNLLLLHHRRRVNITAAAMPRFITPQHLLLHVAPAQERLNDCRC